LAGDLSPCKAKAAQIRKSSDVGRSDVLDTATQSGMNLPHAATLRRSFGPAPAPILGHKTELTLPGGRYRR
jgi:hypothetical protein